MIGLILKSFIVGRKSRELREYTRYYKKLTQDLARHKNRIEKLLQMNGFKLSSVLSEVTGVSGLRLLNTLSHKGSVTLEEVKAALAKGVRRTPEDIERAINGQMKYTSRLLLRKMLSRLESLKNEMEDIYAMMDSLARVHEFEASIIESIPGMGRLSTMYLLAEMGSDLSSFKTANHLTAWAGLAPKDHESAGKLKYSKTKKGNFYIKTALIECAWSAVRVKNTRLSNWYWRNAQRLGNKKAITAVARKLLVYIYTMLKNAEPYDDSLDVADTQNLKASKLDSARKIVAHHSYNSDEKKQRVDKIQRESHNTPLSTQMNLDTHHITEKSPAEDNTSKSVQKPGRLRKNTDGISSVTRQP